MGQPLAVGHRQRRQALPLAYKQGRGHMNILIWFLTAIHVIIAVFLTILVLMQKSHEQGVGAAFGGGMTDTVFGGGTTTALVRMTIYCALALLFTTVVLAVLHSHRTPGSSSLHQKAAQPPAAAPSEPGTAPMPLPSGSTPQQPEAPVNSTLVPPPPPPPATGTATAPTAPPATQPGPQPEQSK